MASSAGKGIPALDNHLPLHHHAAAFEEPVCARRLQARPRYPRRNKTGSD